MDASDIKRDDTLKSFFNPCSKSVFVYYKDDNNVAETIELMPLKMATYPAYKANVLIKHIADAVINERNLKYVTPDKRDEIIKEIVV